MTFRFLLENIKKDEYNRNDFLLKANPFDRILRHLNSISRVRIAAARRHGNEDTRSGASFHV